MYRWLRAALLSVVALAASASQAKADTIGVFDENGTPLGDGSPVFELLNISPLTFPEFATAEVEINGDSTLIFPLFAFVGDASPVSAGSSANTTEDFLADPFTITSANLLLPSDQTGTFTVSYVNVDSNSNQLPGTALLGPSDFATVDFTPTAAVPEPGALTLTLVGLITCAAMAWTRRDPRSRVS